MSIEFSKGRALSSKELENVVGGQVVGAVPVTASVASSGAKVIDSGVLMGQPLAPAGPAGPMGPVK